MTWIKQLIFIIKYWFTTEFQFYLFLFSSFVLDQNHLIFRRHRCPMTPMLRFLCDLPNVWTNMLCTQILCFSMSTPTLNTSPSQTTNMCFLVFLTTYPTSSRGPGTKLYPILDLELVLIMDTPELTLLNDLLESLSNHDEDQSLFTLDGTFSPLGDQFESNSSNTQELQNIPIEFSRNQWPDHHCAHVILTFERSHVLYLKVCHWHIN